MSAPGQTETMSELSRVSGFRSSSASKAVQMLSTNRRFGGPDGNVAIFCHFRDISQGILDYRLRRARRLRPIANNAGSSQGEARRSIATFSVVGKPDSNPHAGRGVTRSRSIFGARLPPRFFVAFSKKGSRILMDLIFAFLQLPQGGPRNQPRLLLTASPISRL